MKKFLFIASLLIAVCSFQSANAQYETFKFQKDATVTGADTLTSIFRYPGSTTLSVAVKFNAENGTTGKVFLYGSIIGTTYTILDSVAVSHSGATAAKEYNFNRFTNSKFDKPDFYFYKAVYLQSAGSVTAAEGKALIRTGGSRN